MQKQSAFDTPVKFKNESITRTLAGSGPHVSMLFKHVFSFQGCISGMICGFPSL